MQNNGLAESDLSQGITTGYRLSPQQRFQWRLQKQTRLPNSQIGILLTGPIENVALQSAFDTLCAQHEILRTTYPRVPGMALPVQAVGSDSHSEWRHVDLSSLPPAEQDARLAELIEQERDTALDLEQDPVIRLTLANLQQDRRLLLITAPAVSMDRRSLANLACELAAACSPHAPVESGEEPLQYVQYAEWQDDLQQSDDEHAVTGRTYWQGQAQERTLPPDLPFSRTAAASDVFVPGIFKINLDGELVGKLESAASQARVTPSALLETVWAILLFRLTGVSTFTLGHGCDGRAYPELEGTLGVLAKTLPLQFRLEPSNPFSLTLREADAAIHDATGWEEYYLPEADDATPFFPYRFDFEDLSDLTLPPGFAVSHLQADTETFHLGLACRRMGAELEIQFPFDPAYFQASDISRVAAMYQTLLQDALAQPEAGIGSLQIVPEAERRQLIVDWNRTEKEFGTFLPVHRQFEAAAHAHPDAIAVVFEDQQISYGELNARANRLAHHLRKRGAGPDVVVGLCLERSLELVVGMLGILKAGAAYLPLDPTLPKERLVGMLTDSGAPLLVTTAEREAIFGAAVGCVLINQNVLDNPGEADTDPENEVQGEHLVYVIYTSGSTGKPKGVALEHRNLFNYVRGVSERLELPERASYATVSTFAADLGNTAVFPALCSGGCLHIVSHACAMDSQQWREYFGKHAIDCLKIVPSHLAALLGDSKDLAALLPRRTLVLGGEASRWELVGRIAEAVPGLRLLNHYGPTETTVGVLTYLIEKGHSAETVGSTTVPIGRPLPNSHMYLLNEYRQPVPTGVAGELYIGGAGVGRGYLNQPELTAERFLQDPFSADPAARVYRTGDLCRYLADGNIEFLGRIDHQVKIRGYRIELGEIESVLRSHPEVRETVVLAREDVPGDRQLVAYIVSKNGAFSTSEMRDYLREKLPDFMLPRVIVPLNRLPLTSNGKVDRAALPAPDTSGASQEYLAPRNALEETLADLWSQLLRRERISVTDSFFDIGGHSLLALQVISRIRDVLQIELPIRMLFEAPTIAGLAERIAAEQKAGATVRPPVVRVDRKESLPLSFAQQRLWFIDQLEPGSYLYNVAIGIRFQGALNVEALRLTLAEIVRRHEVLRTTFPNTEANPVQVITEAGEWSMPIRDLSTLPSQECELEAHRLLEEEAQRPFDLASGPLFRATLLRLDVEEHWLVIVMHHIVTDGWSRGVFVKEFGALYADFCAGRPSSLPELPIQYADYAAWQRGWLQGDVLEEQLAYWKNQLVGAPALLELPTDRPRADMLDPEGAWEYFSISKATTEKLAELSKQEGATLFMTLLAAFNVLLSRYTRTKDIVVGTDVANRNAKELEDLIGFFLNHVVLRTDLSGSPTFRELLGRVRNVATEAFAHQEMPFDKLVEALNPERRGNHTPLFQVLFVLQNAPRTGIAFPGLTMSALKVQHEVSKYDIALFLNERADGIGGAFLYKQDLFDSATIASMKRRFETLLASIVAQPDAVVHTLEIMPEAEKEKLQTEIGELRNSKLAMLQSATRQAAK